MNKRLASCDVELLSRLKNYALWGETLAFFASIET